jgi:hypothetical protein
MFARMLTPVVLLILLSPMGLAPARAAETAGFRAGAAAVDVSLREVPISMLGSLGDRKAASLHDPLFARALVLDDGQTRVAIVLCDNCAMPSDLLDQAVTIHGDCPNFLGEARENETVPPLSCHPWYNGRY